MEITSQSACYTNPSITARLRMTTGLKKASSLSAPQGNPRRRKPPTVTPAAKRRPTTRQRATPYNGNGSVLRAFSR